jgi:hypothetical protein
MASRSSCSSRRGAARHLHQRVHEQHRYGGRLPANWRQLGNWRGRLSVADRALGFASSGVGTIPNALVFGTGHIALPRMLHAGFFLNLASAAIITIGLTLAAPFL